MQTDVEEIKHRLNIVDVAQAYLHLKKMGAGWKGLCPFHQDTHPSMQVSPDKGIAYCFACSSGGHLQFLPSDRGR